MTAFEEIGGEKLREVIVDFYEAVANDAMIGFFFRGTDRPRLVEKEWELAAKMLGNNKVPYTGKPIRQAHAAHPIMGGHFNRRLQILINTMDAHNVSETVKGVWVAHTEALRGLVTSDKTGECVGKPARLQIFEENPNVNPLGKTKK